MNKLMVLVVMMSFSQVSLAATKVERFHSSLSKTNSLQSSIVEQAVLLKLKVDQTEKIAAVKTLAESVDQYRAAVNEALAIPEGVFFASSLGRLMSDVRSSFGDFEFTFNYRILKAISGNYVTSVQSNDEERFRELADKVTVIQDSVKKMLLKAEGREVGVGLPPIP